MGKKSGVSTSAIDSVWGLRPTSLHPAGFIRALKKLRREVTWEDWDGGKGKLEEDLKWLVPGALLLDMDTRMPQCQDLSSSCHPLWESFIQSKGRQRTHTRAPEFSARWKYLTYFCCKDKLTLSSTGSSSCCCSMHLWQTRDKSSWGSMKSLELSRNVKI